MKSFSKILFLSIFLLFASQCLAADDSTLVKKVEYAVANATVVPVREKPSEGAEQATQLLFGEVCEVIDRLPSWTKIRNLLDKQEGWVSHRMLTLTETTDLLSDAPTAVVVTPMAAATPIDSGAHLLLTLGTRLPNYAQGTFEVLGQQYLIDSSCVSQPISHSDASNHDRVTIIAKSLLNTPYLWGGKNLMGLDCSGFTQVVYAAMGVNLLRNAREQITQGEVVPSLSEAMPGDLAFFDHSDRDPKATKISHVGLLLSPTEIIHCAGGRVHIDRIDANGIYLPDGTMTHHLVQIKRYF